MVICQDEERKRWNKLLREESSENEIDADKNVYEVALCIGGGCFLTPSNMSA